MTTNSITADLVALAALAATLSTNINAGSPDIPAAVISIAAIVAGITTAQTDAATTVAAVQASKGILGDYLTALGVQTIIPPTVSLNQVRARELAVRALAAVQTV